MNKKVYLFALLGSTCIHSQAFCASFSPGTPHSAIEPSYNLTNVADITSPKNFEKETPEIYFSADEMENNQELQIITASGDVNIIRNTVSLKADKVIYNQKEDIITAVGNVIIIEKNGSMVFSDYVELSDKMSQGEMQNIKVILKDQSRIAARKIKKFKNDDKEMYNAVYSACDICKGEEPLWQIKADKITHDAAKQDIDYNNVTLEAKGVPVFYTPFLSHPDPSVKRRSGFLAPTLGSNSYLGATLQPRYFIDISKHEDFTFSPILSSDKGVVLDGTYRKNFYSGNLEAQGSFLRDDDKSKDRGHLFANGRYELNDYWVASTNVNYASDGAYLKDLSLDKKDDAWLTSSAKLEGFDYRNYAAVEGYYYKLISTDLPELDKPHVFPIMSYENISDPQSYGAYTKTNLEFASVNREEETSSQRATMINSWILPYTSPFGEKYRLQASLKSDAYYVDNYLNPDNETYDGTVGRMFPQLGLEWKLPFVRATESSRQILEPTIVAVAAPSGGNKINKIPNDDSLYKELDDTNILDLDRYSGYDRNDSGSRVSYGLNWSTYGDKTGRTSAFIAQSYNVDSDENFPYGNSEKSSNFSDYVGRVYAAPNEYLDLNYRFRMDKDNYELKYSELSANAGPPILNAYVGYIYLQEDENSVIQGYDERKELFTSIRSALSRDWSILVYNRQDLTKDGGSLEYGSSLIYEDECLKLITNMRRNNSSDPDFEGDFEVSVTFLLKTLGGFGSK